MQKVSNALEHNKQAVSVCQEKSSVTGKPYFLSTDRTFEKTSGRFIQGSGVFSSKVLSVGKKTSSRTLFDSVPTDGGFVSIRDRVPSTAGGARPILALDVTSGEKLKSESLFPVSGHKRFCQSAWCPICFRRRFHERVVSIFAPYNWRSTRHVILTVDPSLFSSPVEAFNEIREKRLVAQFIRRLRRGVKEKQGSKWVQKIQPLEILRWAWFLEWHKNGFPHYHVFIQVPQEGSAGMIGGDRLRDSWKLGKIVKELYFENENHFREMTGYYSNKGYFEKGKKYQGELPGDIINTTTTKIRRMNSSEQKHREKTKKIIIEDEDTLSHCAAFEEPNAKECFTFFDDKKGGHQLSLDDSIDALERMKKEGERADEEKDEIKRIVNYKAILTSCGKSTYIEMDIGNFRLTAICEISWDRWKTLCGGVFDSMTKSYIARLKKEEIDEILKSVRQVCSLLEYMGPDDWKRAMKLADDAIEEMKAYGGI